MPKIEGYHPYCRSCGDENATPRYKWCFSCRLQERQRKRRRGNWNGVQKLKTNACGLAFIDIVDAADPKETLVDGLQCRPGHKLGWWEVC